MLRKATNFFKKISQNVEITSKKIIGNAGIIPIINYANSGYLAPLLKQFVIDNRCQLRIWYTEVELILGMIFKLLDGDKRFYHFRNDTNNELFKNFFNLGKVPHRNTFRYFVLRNPLLYRCLTRVLFKLAIIHIKEAVKSGKLTQITIDVDQFAREIFGSQKGVSKGYKAGKKNAKLYQVQPWSIRETGCLLGIQLRAGKTNCVKNFDKYLKLMIPELKKLGIPIYIAADSGYESEATMEYLDSNNVFFIFAEKHRKSVKTRGKNSKNKREVVSTGVIYKERKKISKNKHVFREVFIQVKKLIDENGQLYFREFASDEFTNVFITNLKVSAKSVYKQYKEHAVIEKINEELKNDFCAGIAHNESLDYNMALTQITAIAYNVKMYYLNSLICNGFSNINKNMKLSTLRTELIHIPGIISTCGNVLKIKLSKNGFRNFNKYLKPAA